MTTRLIDAGVVSFTWEEDDEDGTIQGEGLQSYEITEEDGKWELAIFQGPKCIRITEAQDLTHAVAMAYSSDAVCRWYIKEGKDHRGRKVNDRGWRV